MISRFPVIVGPTAGGKSALAITLCEALRRTPHTRLPGSAEIITMDSMQVFRGMDIGTAKPSPAERDRVPHHLVDIASPAEPFSVERWLEEAQTAIESLRSRGVLPIVVGGTHLYAKALLEGLFEGPPASPEIRAQLEPLPTTDLRRELEQIDPDASRRIHPNDRRRAVRAIEVFRLTGEPISALQRQWDRGSVRPDALLVGLTWSSDALNRRINARVRSMIEAGLVEEARSLYDLGLLGEQAREAIGYKQLIAHFEGGLTLDEAIERIKIETRRFAKNQRTWLRRLRTTPGSVWLDAEHTDHATMANQVRDALIRNETA